MDAEGLIGQMEMNAGRILGLVQGVGPEQAAWKPDPESWSILEVINHLYDEEREDFRVRLDIVLHAPGRAWPPIDPPGWVTARRYNERELEASLQGFLTERQASLRWLRGLGSPDWSARISVPWGTITAGELFAAWAAHDLLHMRQLVELQRAFNLSLSAPYSSRYAGEW